MVVDTSALREGGVAPLSTELPDLPDLEADLAGLGATHAGIAAAERSLELASMRLQGMDHEGSSPNAVSDAQAEVATADRLGGRAARPRTRGVVAARGRACSVDGVGAVRAGVGGG